MPSAQKAQVNDEPNKSIVSKKESSFIYGYFRESMSNQLNIIPEITALVRSFYHPIGFIVNPGSTVKEGYTVKLTTYDVNSFFGVSYGPQIKVKYTRFQGGQSLEYSIGPFDFERKEYFGNPITVKENGKRIYYETSEIVWEQIYSAEGIQQKVANLYKVETDVMITGINKYAVNVSYSDHNLHRNLTIPLLLKSE